MSDAQLACLAIFAGPFLLGCIVALGNLVPVGAGPAPSPKRVLRWCLAGPVWFALAVIVGLLELIDDLNILLHAGARRAVIGLRSWMIA
ncbi:hypothetical protein [Methylobacterium sp. V23]|uniref:hypothetical protein n=1 Tax=Methylobacterium sp. V23 TaxID=2044878 RepID=UPI000CDAFAB9|nr:hypothetical protein [Methylobacterium sp. V23]POR42532.1 hypothetical protein CRT23_12120 [Methylobacterium sp. V23]